MSGRGPECPSRRPITAENGNHWLDGSANGVRRLGHGNQWNAPKGWARGFPHMLPLVNCLEKGLAKPQAHERPVRVCGRAAASYPDAAPATDLILKPLRPKRLFFLVFIDIFTFWQLLSSPHVTDGEYPSRLISIC